MSATSRVLLFGGSFDPLHHGHLIIARDVAERLSIDRVILIPSRTPPHKADVTLAAVEHRLEMCRLATEGDPIFEVSDWEARREGPNYTLHTVEHFSAELGPDTALHWLVGMDSLAELHTWYRAEELVRACTIVTAARSGFDPPTSEEFARRFSASATQRLMDHVVATRRIDISSTDIRMRIGAGAPIRYLTPPAVESYIRACSLYR